MTDTERGADNQLVSEVPLQADSRTPQQPIEKMTVQQLRAELQKKYLSITGKKKVLLNRLQRAIEENVDDSEFDSSNEVDPINDDEEVDNPVTARRIRQHRQTEATQSVAAGT